MYYCKFLQFSIVVSYDFKKLLKQRNTCVTDICMTLVSCCQKFLPCSLNTQCQKAVKVKSDNITPTLCLSFFNDLCTFSQYKKKLNEWKIYFALNKPPIDNKRNNLPQMYVYNINQTKWTEYSDIVTKHNALRSFLIFYARYTYLNVPSYARRV